MVVFAETENSQKIKEVLISQNEDLISQEVYFVPMGTFSDPSAVHYKENMLACQKQLNHERRKILILYNFDLEILLVRGGFRQTLKEHIMTIKAENGEYIYKAIEFVRPKEETGVS